MSRRRAAVLVAVHVLVALHLVHYAVTGRTLSPVEPSEAMHTLDRGYINAGVIFFASALLATAVFGRFFCGWGCHLVAYQDLCRWLLIRVKIKPRPFRSRILVFLPLGVGLYMFVWPLVKRSLFPARYTRFAGLSNHLLTDDFWATFPGPVIAVLTILVCGFAAVYFLGAKGFCTYACPYGGFFSLLDRAAAGRIRVTDACEHCGHCTATCTSNVRVHEEVRRYGMVVDPGCMKCMDCVTVCPNDALYWGMGRPALVRGPGRGRSSRVAYDFTVYEEIIALVLFLAATMSFRGLYGGPPLLMSVGLGAITAYVALKLWRLIHAPTVRVQNLRLKTAGRLSRSGVVFSVIGVSWLVVSVHSAFVQWHAAWGRHYVMRLQTARAEETGGDAGGPERISREHSSDLAAAMRHLSLADRWGWLDTLEVKLNLVWLHAARGDERSAEKEARCAVKLAPDEAGVHRMLADVLAQRGLPKEAIDARRRAMDLGTPTMQDYFVLAEMLSRVGRIEEAAEVYLRADRAGPLPGAALFNAGSLLWRSGRSQESLAYLERAKVLLPNDVDVHIELGMVHARLGRVDDAVRVLEEAAAMDPSDPEARAHLDMIRRSLR